MCKIKVLISSKQGQVKKKKLYYQKKTQKEELICQKWETNKEVLRRIFVAINICVIYTGAEVVN